MSGQQPNRHGSDWMILRARALDRIEAWRKELESLDVAPDRAQQLRGMIFALREQNDFVEPTPLPEVKEPHYG